MRVAHYGCPDSTQKRLDFVAAQGLGGSHSASV